MDSLNNEYSMMDLRNHINSLDKVNSDFISALKLFSEYMDSLENKVITLSTFDFLKATNGLSSSESYDIAHELQTKSDLYKSIKSINNNLKEKYKL